MGAAYLAGLAEGVWSSTEQIAALPRSVERFEPTMSERTRAGLIEGWQDAVARTRLHP
jgi:glycerol kinase